MAARPVLRLDMQSSAVAARVCLQRNLLAPCQAAMRVQAGCACCSVWLCSSWLKPTAVLGAFSLGMCRGQRYGLPCRPLQQFHMLPLQGERQVFAKTPEGTTFSAKSFSDLHLSRPLIRACQALGYQHPTPIQVGACTSLLPAAQLIQPVGHSANGLAAMMRLMDSPLLALSRAVSITTPSLSCRLCP